MVELEKYKADADNHYRDKWMNSSELRLLENSKMAHIMSLKLKEVREAIRSLYVYGYETPTDFNNNIQTIDEIIEINNKLNNSTT